MPPLPSVPGVLKVSFRFTVDEDTNATVRWHVSYTGTAPTNAVATSIATGIYGSAAAQFPNVMADSVSLQEVTVEDLSVPSGGIGSHTAGTGGSRGASRLPAGAAVMINFPIARRYRGGKPRSYFPVGVSGDLTDAQSWGATLISDVFTAVGVVLAYCNGTVISGTTLAGWVNVSYYQGFTSVTNPITGRTKDVPKIRTGAIPVDPATTYSVHPKVASQRRRNLTRG